MRQVLVKDIKIPIAALATINALNYIIPLPVIVQMVASATLLTYIGCILSVPIQSATYKQIKNCEKELRGRREESSWLRKCWQIWMYPVTATATLLLLYFIVNSIQQITKQLLLNAVFIAASTYYCFRKAYRTVSAWLKNKMDDYEVSEELSPYLQWIALGVLLPLFCALPALVQVITKHWLIDNLYAIGFTLLAIKQANIKSFKIALPVLWLLFIYDLYWVYGSDVMVTVAKNIDLPLKLKFPYLSESNSEFKFSMLGLGDIVLPGLLISLCIKYDIDCCILSDRKPKKVQEFRYPLFYSMLFAYALSLIATYLALFYFNHAQPALVFIVPICSLALLAFTFVTKDRAIWKYDSKSLTRRKSQTKEEESQSVI